MSGVIVRARTPRTAVILVLVFGLLAFAAWCVFPIQRLEPGWAAVRIHYDRGGERESIPAGGYIAYNSVTERVAKYPTAQQSLVMVRREGEPDQSVACLDQRGITINLDSTTFWRVDPASVADLYELRPDVPLTSTDLNAGIGNIIVRRLARGAMHDVCGEMSYQDIFGPKRATFVEAVEGRLRAKLEQFHIILDGFQLGSVFLQPDQQKVFAEQAQVEQAAITAQAAAERARREAEAALIQAESRKQVSIKEAEAEAAHVELAAAARAQAARTEAEGEADAIRLRQQALAESPDYRAFQLGLEQARHQPSTYVGPGAPATAQITVPPPAAEPSAPPTPAAEPSPAPTPKGR